MYILTTSTAISEQMHRLVTVDTYSDFIVLPHWDTGPPAPWPGLPLSHIILALSHPVLSTTLTMPNTWSKNYQFLRHRFDWTRVWNGGFQIPRSTKMLYWFGHLRLVLCIRRIWKETMHWRKLIIRVEWGRLSVSRTIKILLAYSLNLNLFLSILSLAL